MFKTLFKKIDATQFTFSRNGIREGYVMNLIRQRHLMSLKDNVRQDALRHLANEYNIEEDSANRRLKLAQSLLDQLLKHGNLKVSDQEKALFVEGAYIYYLGSFIDSDSSSPHTYYLIANSMINGFSHKTA